MVDRRYKVKTTNWVITGKIVKRGYHILSLLEEIRPCESIVKK